MWKESGSREVGEMNTTISSWRKIQCDLECSDSSASVDSVNRNPLQSVHSGK